MSANEEITAVLPAMAEFTGDNLWRLARLWSVILLANLFGSFVAALICTTAPVLSSVMPRSFTFQSISRIQPQPRCTNRVVGALCRRRQEYRTLKYQSRSYGEDWSDVEQRVAIAWTPCRFGGERPWFVCSVAANGVYCGRRVTKLYGAGRLFACRHCYRLAYASQQESARRRGLGKSQKIRMRLGGSPNMFEEFPDKPKGMHWRTYERWRLVNDLTEKRYLMSFVERRLGRRSFRQVPPPR